MEIYCATVPLNCPVTRGMPLNVGYIQRSKIQDSVERVSRNTNGVEISHYHSTVDSEIFHYLLSARYTNFSTAQINLMQA